MATYDSWEFGDYEAVRKPMEPAHPERRLLRAVLSDAMATILKENRARGRRTVKMRREALAWVVSDDRSGTFAFERICETLGIHADRLRTRIFSTIRDRDGACTVSDV